MNIFNYTIPEFGENFKTLLEDKDINISQIVSSDKVEQKEYCQSKDEFVVLLDGKATLKIEDKTITLKKGDCMHIPAKTKHTILKTSKGALWLAIYYS